MSLRLSLLGISLVTVVAGCNNSDRQPVYPVRGTIRLEGQSMPGGGSIAFIPMERQKGKTAGGEIRENGTYELTTYAVGDGSMAGYFRVVITQSTAMEPRAAIPDGQAIPEGGMQGLAISQDDHIPAAYGDPGKSPLRATVEANSNVLNFDLQRTLDARPGDGAMPPGVAARPSQPILIAASVKRSRGQSGWWGRNQ